MVLGLAAAALEGIALGLGGRSRAFPSLSTVVDQALVWHLTRWLLFVLWLAVAAWPLGRGVLGHPRPFRPSARRTNGDGR